MSIKDVQLASKWLTEADAILVTASNGLSISEGLNLFSHDDKLQQVLGDLAERYHFPNLLSAMGYPYENQLDYWRVMARIVEYYGYNYQSSQYMTRLKKMIGNKPYFVWTSNIDHHFNLAGFKNTFEIEGNWMDGICSAHPEQHGRTSLRTQLHEVYLKDQAGELSDADIPVCAECGAPLQFNMAGDDFQINDEQQRHIQKFLTDTRHKRLVVLELGIGARNQMIKAPSMQLIAANQQSRYITINQSEVVIPEQIAAQSVGFSSTIADAFKELADRRSYGAETQGPGHHQEKSSDADAQEQLMQKFFPYYMIDPGFRPNSRPLYLTIDKQHPSYLHTTKYGQSFMYDMGSTVRVHCFTTDGRYYQIRLGLDKAKGDVHAFYADPGTFVGIESLGDSFGVINTDVPDSDKGEIYVPRYKELLRVFPQQKEIIERLLLSE